MLAIQQLSVQRDDEQGKTKQLHSKGYSEDRVQMDCKSQAFIEEESINVTDTSWVVRVEKSASTREVKLPSVDSGAVTKEKQCDGTD